MLKIDDDVKPGDKVTLFIGGEETRTDIHKYVRHESERVYGGAFGGGLPPRNTEYDVIYWYDDTTTRIDRSYGIDTLHKSV